MANLVYEDISHGVYYIFNANDTLELDKTAISSVRSGKARFLLLPKRQYAFISREAIHIYLECPSDRFLEWKSRQQHLARVLLLEGFYAKFAIELPAMETSSIMEKIHVMQMNKGFRESAHIENDRLSRLPQPEPVKPAANASASAKEEAKAEPEQKPQPKAHIIRLVIEDAIEHKQECSITQELITKENGTCIFPCYHCFSKEGISQWLQMNTTCPECRETATLV
jgi:hypothetical protein